jgi:hypothetical protein
MQSSGPSYDLGIEHRAEKMLRVCRSPYPKWMPSMMMALITAAFEATQCRQAAAGPYIIGQTLSVSSARKLIGNVSVLKNPMPVTVDISGQILCSLGGATPGQTGVGISIR